MSATNEEMITTMPASRSRKLPADLSIATREGKAAEASITDGATRKSRSAARPRREKGVDGRTGARSGARGANARAGVGENDLRKQLREFASVHSAGWNHDQWLALLAKLENQGFDVSAPEGIGAELEKERLDVVLTRAGGLGRTGRQNLLARYPALWAFLEADSEELAITAEVSRRVIDRIKAEAAGHPVEGFGAA